MVNIPVARYKIIQGVWLELDLLLYGGMCASADGGVVATWWTLMDQSSPLQPASPSRDWRGKANAAGERRR
jgi:hypothetical protein